MLVAFAESCDGNYWQSTRGTHCHGAFAQFLRTREFWPSWSCAVMGIREGLCSV
ncbi:hypothetical protein BaRGS_00015232, partial [Batillaria attramentaria]